MNSQSINACIPSSASVSPGCFSIINGSNVRHCNVSTVISGTIVDDDVTSARSTGKPNNNHKGIHVARSYQHVSFSHVFCDKRNQCVGFFMTTLLAIRLCDLQMLIIVIRHHHACTTREMYTVVLPYCCIMRLQV